MTGQRQSQFHTSRNTAYSRTPLPVWALVRLVAGLAFRKSRRSGPTGGGSAKHELPPHATRPTDGHGSPDRERQDEVDLTANVRLRAWWAGGSSLLFGLGIYLIGLIVLGWPSNLVNLTVRAREKLDDGGFDPSSVALGVAGAALTMFVATTLSEGWRSTKPSGDRRELGRRAATAALTDAVYLFGASLTWTVLMDALVTQSHHPVEVFTAFLVILLCVGLFAVAASPDDVLDHREKERTRERDALRQVILDLTEPGSSRRRTSWWSHVAAAVAVGGIAVVLTVAVVWGAVKIELSAGGDETAHVAIALLPLLGAFSWAQAFTASRTLVEITLMRRLRRRGGVRWWIVIGFVGGLGLLVFFGLAALFAIAGLWWVSVGFLVAQLLSLGVVRLYKCTSLSKGDVVRLAEVRLRSTDEGLTDATTDET